jgi:hypothetical protein
VGFAPFVVNDLMSPRDVPTAFTATTRKKYVVPGVNFVMDTDSVFVVDPVTASAAAAVSAPTNVAFVPYSTDTVVSTPFAFTSAATVAPKASGTAEPVATVGAVPFVANDLMSPRDVPTAFTATTRKKYVVPGASFEIDADTAEAVVPVTAVATGADSAPANVGFVPYSKDTVASTSFAFTSPTSVAVVVSAVAAPVVTVGAVPFVVNDLMSLEVEPRAFVASSR